MAEELKKVTEGRTCKKLKTGVKWVRMSPEAETHK